MKISVPRICANNTPRCVENQGVYRDRNVVDIAESTCIEPTGNWIAS